MLLSFAVAPVAVAQMNTGIPSGSPLDSMNGTGSSSRQGNDNVSASGLSQGSTASENPFVGQQAIQPYNVTTNSNDMLTLQQLLGARSQRKEDDQALTRQFAKPGEFEIYVERLLGRKLPRYGESLILPAQRDFAAPATATVPPEYVVQPGDTIVIALAGSMNGSIEQEVDNSGRLFISGVGPVQVAGVRHAELRDVIARAIGTQFRGFTVSVDIRKLRGIRVYVTGLANNPGAFTLSSLSTLANAVFQAGGPSSGGSWRSIKLYRNGQEVVDFDLYQLMRGGRSVNDVQLQNEDVLFIPPAGEQVAVIGSVQEEAIYEAKPGENLADMLAAAGGPNTLADRSRVILYRTGEAEQVGPRQIAFTAAGGEPIKGGDIVQMLSTGSLTMPIDRQSVLVRVEGEVRQPGIYYAAPNTPINEIMARAGGLTPRAYPFGTKFTRQSVKIQQQESYREAIRQLELTLAAAPLTADTAIGEAERSSQIAGARAVLDRLRQVEPDGRVVLQLSPDAADVPGNILLENNDAIYVPPMASTVGVFGAVYRPASFLVGGGKAPRRVKDYVEMAGGTLRAADRGNIFLVRANGEVVSRKRGSLNARILPGDIVFVPVRTQGNSWWAKFKDVTQTLFQLGLSAATVVAVAR
ncbi:SLBB domain-containing protein [Sphingobium sp. AN641]|uniref:SLBB domain-containing protein n=1 Tax=Sphingobium sp. AN641 TaxID=3133443 RepID=UPI0030C46D53